MNDGVISQKAPEQGILREVRDQCMGASRCHQWPLSQTEQSHKLRRYVLLIQQVFISILGLISKTSAISLSMNDFYHLRETEEGNGKCNFKGDSPYLRQCVQVHLCILAALPEAHGGK